MEKQETGLGFTFHRFLIAKTLASISFILFLIFLMWTVVDQYKTTDPTIAIFLAGMIPVIYLLVMLVTAIPIGHSIDRLNNSALAMLSAGIMAAGFCFFATGFSLLTVYISTAIVAAGYTLNGDTFSAMIKKLVSNEGITRATSYNLVSNSSSSLIGVAMGGVSLIFLSQYAAMILIAISLGSMFLAFPISMKKNGLSSEDAGSKKGYRQVLGFFRSILGLTMLALVLNGFFISIDVYASGLFNIYLHSTPLYYTLFDAAVPGTMIIGSIIANKYEKFFDRPGTIALVVMLYSPTLLILGISRSALIDIATAGLLGFINPLVNVPIISRLTKFTPVEIFGRVMAFMRIFIQSSTPVMAAVFSFASIYFSVPNILVVVGLLMLPFSAFGFSVLKTFYSKTIITETSQEQAALED